jgi:hypothetical protein
MAEAGVFSLGSDTSRLQAHNSGVDTWHRALNWKFSMKTAISVSYNKQATQLVFLAPYQRLFSNNPLRAFIYQLHLGTYIIW